RCSCEPLYSSGAGTLGVPTLGVATVASSAGGLLMGRVPCASSSEPSATSVTRLDSQTGQYSPSLAIQRWPLSQVHTCTMNGNSGKGGDAGGNTPVYPQFSRAAAALHGPRGAKPQAACSGAGR